jgi:hypothetical protein
MRTAAHGRPELDRVRLRSTHSGQTTCSKPVSQPISTLRTGIASKRPIRTFQFLQAGFSDSYVRFLYRSVEDYNDNGWRRDRLHAYKRPCWAPSQPRLGPDSNRAAGLHPLNGEYISCSASPLIEFARCRSDLSLSFVECVLNFGTSLWRCRLGYQAPVAPPVRAGA